MHTQAGKSVEMENFFSRLTLDIIGKAVFNYDFDSLTHDDPVIQVCLPSCAEVHVSGLAGPMYFRESCTQAEHSNAQARVSRICP